MSSWVWPTSRNPTYFFWKAFQTIHTDQLLSKCGSILFSFHVWIHMNVFVVCSTFSQHICFLILGSRAFMLHLPCMILRFLSPLCGLNTNLNQGPSSWSFSLPMDYCIVILHQGWDKMPLCILMDTVILEVISSGTSKFVHVTGIYVTTLI